MTRYCLSIMIAISICACNHVSIKDIEGTYSYKTSGILAVTDQSSQTTNDISLDNIVGTLDIKRLNNKDSVLLIFNEMLGDITTVRAALKGDSIYMTPYKKVYSIVDQSKTSALLIDVPTVTNADYYVMVEGKGVVMDGTIIFYQQINSGKELIEGQSRIVRATDIRTVAKKN